MQQPSLPMRCRVVDIHYAGEEGGIVCKLNLRGSETKQAFYVSITHLIFERRMPLFRQIDAYQRHRIKKVKREGSLDH